MTGALTGERASLVVMGIRKPPAWLFGIPVLQEEQEAQPGVQGGGRERNLLQVSGVFLVWGALGAEPGGPAFLPARERGVLFSGSHPGFFLP